MYHTDVPTSLKRQIKPKRKNDQSKQIAVRIRCRSLCPSRCDLLGPAVERPSRITPEDYFSFEFISDPNLSPDGKFVAYVLTKIDRGQNRRNSAIWMVTTDGPVPPGSLLPARNRRLRLAGVRMEMAGVSIVRPASEAASTTAATTPVASPTPAEQNRNQVYLLSMNGGEARRLTNLKNGVSVFRWSPDGNRLVVVSRVGPSDSRTDSKNEAMCGIQELVVQVQ